MVWLPILPNDDRAQAESASAIAWNERVHHFWIPDPAVSESFRKALELTDDRAWNVYLLYDRDARWNDEVPRPDSFMHQGRKLPADRALDARVLADEVRALLAPAAAPGAAARQRPGAR